MENYRDDNIPTVNNTAAETTDTDGTTADPAIPEKADDTTKQPETASHNHNVAACEAAAAAGQTVYEQDGMSSSWLVDRILNVLPGWRNGSLDRKSVV